MKVLEQTITSLEVAKMVGKQHNDLMKDVRRYVSNLNEGDIPHVEFFNESTYLDKKGEERPCFDVTKKGCEYIANKLTGVKGAVFTARYINRFHDMEDVISHGLESGDSESSTKLLNAKARLENARTRKASLLLKMSEVNTLSPTYKTVLVSKASEVLTGEQIIPLPKIEQKKRYSATEIGDILGVSSNKIGRIANQNDLKTDEYGEWIRDKSKNSSREVDTFVYYENALPVFEEKIRLTQLASK